MSDKLYRCTGCRTEGDWDSWESATFPGSHRCDACHADGKTANLIQVCTCEAWNADECACGARKDNSPEIARIIDALILLDVTSEKLLGIITAEYDRGNVQGMNEQLAFVDKLIQARKGEKEKT